MDRRALNRATLARQHLLERARRPVPEVVEHLVGMQGQAPDAPYVALWSRVGGFTTDQLAGPLQARELVRTSVMRATMHLMTARDALRVRPVVQSVSERTLRSGSPFGKRLAAAGVAMPALASAGERLLAERPLSRRELADALARLWPDADRDSLSYGVSYLVPAVQLPPRGVWGSSGPPTLASLRAWLGAPVSDVSTVDELFLRYLGAFGPATVADMRTWSGLTGLAEVADRLRPGLWHDGPLLDLPDAPRPDPDMPAPVRFLPEYDNVLLSHADRARVIPDGRRVPLPPGNGARRGTALIDGDYRANWHIDAGGVLTVEPFTPLGAAEQGEIMVEGAALLAFVLPGAEHDVRIL